MSETKVELQSKGLRGVWEYQGAVDPETASDMEQSWKRSGSLGVKFKLGARKLTGNLAHDLLDEEEKLVGYYKFVPSTDNEPGPN